MRLTTVPFNHSAPFGEPTVSTSVRLRQWIQSVIGDVEVSLSAPTEKPEGTGISAFLLGMAPSQAMVGGRSPAPSRYTLRYLVTSWAGSSDDAHALLESVLVAAMRQDGFSVESTPVPPETWIALGIPPQASFVLSVPALRERTVERAPLVRAYMRLDSRSLRPLGGRVVGPDEIPLAHARIELPSLGMFTYTDSDGRFQFGAVPSGPETIDFRVMIKGREFVSTVDPASAPDPLVIHCNVLED